MARFFGKVKLLAAFTALCLSLISCSQQRQKVLQTIKGEATYYGRFFQGKKTKSGETYNMNALTAAHADLGMGTKVKVTNLENNRSVVVTINDEPRTNKKGFIDLSKEAFKKICDLDSGRIKVKMEVLAWGK